MLELLFENVKVYGRYVAINNLDRIEYWNKIKLFLQRPEQKVGINLIDNICENGDKLDLISLLEIAYNNGQLSIGMDEKKFSPKSTEYYDLDNLNSYPYQKLSPKQKLLIESSIQIIDLVTNINSFILGQMNLIQSGGGEELLEPFYSLDLEELTKSNTDYRRVLYTGINQQFVLMSIPPLDTIHMEIHESHDQFIRIEQGEGNAIMGISTYKLKDNSGFIIPAGTPHQIINTSKTEPLKLYTIYSPPEHPDKLIQKTNPDKLVQIESKYKTDNDLVDLDDFVQIQTNPKDDDYKIKYHEYKNKYIVLKKFILKYRKNIN